MPSTWDKQLVQDELREAQTDFHRLLDTATMADLARPTNETRWNNEQLLFHMLFGYMITAALLPLMRLFGRLPRGVGKGYARLLDATTRPFDAINYLGPCAAIHIYGHRRMAAKFDRVIASLLRRLDEETPADLARGMHYPVRWDPFFKDYVTLADIYRYPTQHYNFHRRQLTITNTS
uniref:DinB family protein n=1 Tax=Streptomyces sp. NBC_00003 TaxID=2903608 RepID=A0AAU2UVN4_9ACTN